MRTLYLFVYSLSGLLLLGLISTAQATEYESANLRVTIEPADELSLQDALALALSANAGISVALREREATEGIQLQAAARPNPTISTLIEDTRSSTRETTLQLSQPIELGNKRAARIEAADTRYDAASASVDVKKAEIHADVTSAFYTVLAAQERLLLSRSSLEVAQQARDAARKRVKAGKISPVEEVKSQVAESSVRIEMNQAASALNIARKRLTALWGNPLPQFRLAEGQMEEIQAIPSFENLSARLDEAPALKRARLEVESRRTLANIEQTKRTPDITLSIGGRRNEELGLNQAILGISVPIPIFDRNQGNLQEALSRTDKARDELIALRTQLEISLAAAYERSTSARQAAESIRAEILPDARSVFDAAARGFEFGKFSFLDVLDAQRTLAQAKSQYLDALLDAHQASADIERILGEAIPHFKINP